MMLNYSSESLMNLHGRHTILRTFVSRDVGLLTRAYIVYVRPLLEYNSVTWSPHTLQGIEAVERVQRRFTKRFSGLNKLSYQERLKIPRPAQPRITSITYRFNLVLQN